MQTICQIVRFIPLVTLVAWLADPPAAATARVKLITLPVREQVEIQLDNPGATLVEEERTVPLVKGENEVDFSWANTLIDPSSVELKFLASPDKLDVLDTTFPHDKPQMLYWNAQSDMEGLSEYFIYTVEGTETMPDGWSKRMRSFEGRDVPVKIQYRYRPKEYGDQLVRMYVMTNDEKAKLGTTPLPDGVFRVFRDNGRDGLSYLTQQTIKYVPIGDIIELNLGPDPEVIFELVKLRTFRDNLWGQLHGTNRFKQVGTETTEAEVNASVAGWDDHSIYRQRIRNYTAKPIDVEIRRGYEGHIVFRSQLNPNLHDFQTVEFGTPVASGARQDLLFEVLQHQGRNAKQNDVTLEQLR